MPDGAVFIGACFLSALISASMKCADDTHSRLTRFVHRELVAIADETKLVITLLRHHGPISSYITRLDFSLGIINGFRRQSSSLRLCLGPLVARRQQRGGQAL